LSQGLDSFAGDSHWCKDKAHAQKLALSMSCRRIEDIPVAATKITKNSLFKASVFV
jgi:hypothetical protein